MHCCAMMEASIGHSLVLMMLTKAVASSFMSVLFWNCLCMSWVNGNVCVPLKRAVFFWDPTSYKGFVYLAFQCLISSWSSLCWRLHWIAAQCSQMYVNIWDKFKGSRTCCEDWFFCCNDHAEDVCHLPKKTAPSSSCHGLCAASADAPSPCLHFQTHWSTPHHTLHCYT